MRGYSIPYSVIRAFLLHLLAWPTGSNWVRDVGHDHGIYLQWWSGVGFGCLLVGDACRIARAHYIGKSAIGVSVTFGAQVPDVTYSS